MNNLPQIMLSILMLAAIALTIGGIILLRRKGDTKKAVLMLICAVILIGNVLIWALPV